MPATLIIIAITVAVSWTAFNNQKLLLDSLFWSTALKRGEYYRLFTYGLVHADVMHLLVNMLTLFFFGSFVEQFYQSTLGWWGFPLFYALGIVVSILPTWARHKDDRDYRSLGASGAVMGVLMASVLFDPWMQIYVFFAIPVPAIVYAALFVVYEMWADRSGADRVNHSAHLWGAAYGVVFTVAVEPRVWQYFLSQLAQPRLG